MAQQVDDASTRLVEMTTTLDALGRALDLLERLEAAPHATNIHLVKPREKMRWTVKRLAKRAWVLACEVQSTE